DFSGTPLTNAGSDPPVTVTPGPLDHFDFGNIATQVAGAFFGVTVTARDQYDNLKYDYPDGSQGNLSGLNPAPDQTQPVYNNPITFTGGVANVNVTAFFANNPNLAGDVSELSVSSGGKSGPSNTIKVRPA